MLISTLLVILLTSICLLLLTRGAALRRRWGLQNHKKLPPGPRSYPIIGNLHMMGTLPHRSLATLAKKYGPIMSMKLGLVPTIVISSPRTAELVLKTHDIVFANRPKIQVSDIFSYGAKGVGLAPYGSYWRQTRKFCTLQLLSGTKVEVFAPIRKEEVELMVKEIKESATARKIVNLTVMVKEVTENIGYRLILGRKKDDGFDIRGLVLEMLTLIGAFNLSDYVPFLAPFDLQGFTKRMKESHEIQDKFLEKIISEHKIDDSGKRQKTFVDMLLAILDQPMNPNDEQQYIMDKTNVKAIMSDLLAAALDSSSAIIDWTLAELLKKPSVLTRLHEELDSVIGKNRLVEEKDLIDLPYLDMVIKEILRLHPAVPFLVPHESSEDITIEGYYVPNKSRIIVNLWAIGHDPNVWSENAEEFLPERFVGSNLDVKGHNFELIPFGSGRRGCPGMQLGLIIVKYVVAQFVHCFDWKLPDGMSPSEIDMNEHFGLGVSRKNPLFVTPTYRLNV